MFFVTGYVFVSYAGLLKIASIAEEIVRRSEQRIREHRAFIAAEGIDPPEIAEWRWTG